MAKLVTQNIEQSWWCSKQSWWILLVSLSLSWKVSMRLFLITKRRKGPTIAGNVWSFCPNQSFQQIINWVLRISGAKKCICFSLSLEKLAIFGKMDWILLRKFMGFCKKAFCEVSVNTRVQGSRELTSVLRNGQWCSFIMLSIVLFWSHSCSCSGVTSASGNQYGMPEMKPWSTTWMQALQSIFKPVTGHIWK